MADDVPITDADGTRVPIAADEIGGKKHQRVKVQYGADGEATDASVGNPFPVRPSGALDAPLPVRLSNGTDAIDSTSRELHVREVQLRTGLGTTGDAAVAAGAAGSLNAKARLMTTLLDAIRTAVEPLGNAVSGTEFQVDVVGALPAGDNNIGNVDVVTLPSLPAGTNNIGDVDLASAIPSGTNTIGAVRLVTNTSQGITISTPLISAASTNATSVKASTGLLYGWYVYNANAAVRYLKLYNKSSAPTVGTDVPVLVIPIPPGGGANVLSALGLSFGTGIAMALTTGVANTDTGAVAAGELIVNLFYA